MQIAQVLAGYTLGAADMLRRAMGKKKPEEMAKQREIFLAGAAERGVDAQQAEAIFDLMEHFAGYGFNKSHSAAYALLSYQTAWLKAHHPAAFMAAVLSSDMDHTDKVVGLIDECRHMELAILPPDVNASQYMFTVEGEAGIRYGLGAIKGVGQSAIESIVAEREANGPFADLDDFCRRVDLHKLNRRTLEALIRAGALDPLGSNRATLMAQLPNALQAADQANRAAEVGQDDMFGLAETPVAPQSGSQGPELAEWPEQERLIAEKETLGLYLTGHPITRYEADIARLGSGRIVDLTSDVPAEGTRMPRRPVTVVGLLMDVQKRGGRVSLTLDDRTGRLEATLFEDAWEQYRHLISKDTVVVIEGQLGFDEFINAHRVTVRAVKSMEDARAAYLRQLVLQLRRGDTPDGDAFIGQLRELLAPHRGGQCRVVVHYTNGNATVPVPLGPDWAVHPRDALLDQLNDWLGPDRVLRRYGPARQSEEMRAAG